MAAVVSVILVVDPVVGLVAGGLWFGDAVTTSPVALVLATVCAAVLLVGMVATQSSSDRSAPGAGPHGADIDGERPVTAPPEPGGSRDTPAHAREQVVSATAQGPGTTRLS